MNKYQEIILKSQSFEIHNLIQFVEQICSEQNIYNNYYGNIVTAITEGFQNAIDHGNNFDPEKSVKVSFEQKNYGLEFCIKDEGNGFDSTKISDPTDISNKGNVGRGIFLMNTLSDNTEFLENGTKVCFKFLISSINQEIADARINKLNVFLKKEIKETQSV